MASLSDQISSAITIALDPSTTFPQSQRHEAHLFLSQVKEANQQTWQACLALFLEEDGTNGKKWRADARLFGVQVVGER